MAAPIVGMLAGVATAVATNVIWDWITAPECTLEQSEKEVLKRLIEASDPSKSPQPELSGVDERERARQGRFPVMVGGQFATTMFGALQHPRQAPPVLGRLARRRPDASAALTVAHFGGITQTDGGSPARDDLALRLVGKGRYAQSSLHGEYRTLRPVKPSAPKRAGAVSPLTIRPEVIELGADAAVTVSIGAAYGYTKAQLVTTPLYEVVVNKLSPKWAYHHALLSIMPRGSLEALGISKPANMTEGVRK